MIVRLVCGWSIVVALVLAGIGVRRAMDARAPLGTVVASGGKHFAELSDRVWTALGQYVWSQAAVAAVDGIFIAISNKSFNIRRNLNSVGKECISNELCLYL